MFLGRPLSLWLPFVLGLSTFLSLAGLLPLNPDAKDALNGVIVAGLILAAGKDADERKRLVEAARDAIHAKNTELDARKANGSD